MIQKLFTSIFCLLIVVNSFAQFRVSGTAPYSRYKNLDERIDVKTFDKPDLSRVAFENDRHEKNGDFYRIAKSVNVNLNLNNSGIWTKTDDGRDLWRLKIVIEDALALGVYYDDFWIPNGGELYLYNESKTMVIGAFTHLNNNPNRLFSNELVQGETVTLEYLAPVEELEKASISISEIAYAYRDVHFTYTQNRVNESEFCQININCPEGLNWQDEKRGVARILLKDGPDYGWCSGSLVNNTDENCYPYFLTAYHCGGEASVSDVAQWVFYFNYEFPDCDTPSYTPATKNISGATKVSMGNISGGSDFLLLHFNSYIPFDYNAYFNGWDNNNTPSPSGVCIHHPAGDVKKISTYSSPTYSASPNIGGSQMGYNSTWGVEWAATTSGFGVTEGGSSGSPLFNSAAKVIGTLSGGSSNCDQIPNPGDEFYGKLSYHWQSNGGGSDAQLEPWLDPLGLGVSTMTGMDNCADIPPIANFIATDSVIGVGGSITFTDVSTNFAASRIWWFEEGSPYASAQEQKTITYNTPGTWDVRIIVTSPTGKDTLWREDFVTVVDSTVLMALFSSDVTTVNEGGSVQFIDNSMGNPTSWSWSFPGGSPSVSSVQNPVVSYYSAGTYNVSLVVSDGVSNETETKNGYITVTPQAFTLDFESSADFATTFDPWTVVDGDGQTTYGSSDSDFPGEQGAMSYIAFNPSVAGFSLASAHNGSERCGMAICPSDASASDDWLISPHLSMGTGSSISFWVLSPKPSTWGNDAFKVAVSTSSNNPADFVTISGGSPVEAPSTWTEMTYDLSSYDNQDIYIGIQHVSADMFMFWIDDISVSTMFTGVSDDSRFADVRVYPNPATSEAFIDFGNLELSDIQLSVIDLVGKEIQYRNNIKPGVNNVKIDFSDIAEGIYIIRIQTGEGSFTRKISITK